jgi:Amt family ammonium transporter
MANITAAVCPDAGDTSFMFIATVLVLSMMPGLGFFESGLLRRRSALSVVTQVFVGISVLNLLWFLFGFSLVFGGTYGGMVGDFRYAMFRGLSNKCIVNAPSVPGLIFASFQMMFASITPLLMTGAFAERIRLLGFIPLIVIWEVCALFVHCFVLSFVIFFFVDIGLLFCCSFDLGRRLARTTWSA